jgi:hypothetical protein
MPYTIRKRKCKQADGDKGSYVMSYTDDKGKKHSNCHTSRKKARGQISAIEMDESVEENWVPLAARITDILEEELSILAGAFNLHESDSQQKLKKGDRVRPSRVSSEIMVHTKGKVPVGTILRDNEDGTYDVEWEPLPKPPSYRGDDDDDVSDDEEDSVEYRVPSRNIKRSKSGN